VSTQKITKLFVDKLAFPESGQVFYRDNILKGFAVRVTAGGSKAFILEKRINRKVKRITLVAIQKLPLRWPVKKRSSI
jgi:hypothetical protein